MRSVSLALLLLACHISLFAMTSKGDAGKSETELAVFAAQSLKESVSEAARMFEEKNPGAKVALTLGGSGNLAKMLEAGAECDVFISADTGTMDRLDASAGGADFVDSRSRANVLCGRLCLASADDSCKVRDFASAVEALRRGDLAFAMGDSGVPAGNYMRSVFAFFGLEEKSVGEAVSYGTDVSVVARRIKERAVDCGAVYVTDAISNGLTVLDVADDRMTGGQILYPAAVLRRAHNPELARSFVSFLRFDVVARDIFAKYGFEVI